MGCCCSTTEDQHVPQSNNRLATSQAHARSSGSNPHRNNPPTSRPTPRHRAPRPTSKPDSDPEPARYRHPGHETNTQRRTSTESLPSELLRALEEIWAEEREQETEDRSPRILGNSNERPSMISEIEDGVLPERPFSAPPLGLGRHLSVISAPPQAEFQIMPEFAVPILPPDGVFYEGYAPPVPERIPLDRPPPTACFEGHAPPGPDRIYEPHLSRAETPVEPPQKPPKEFEGLHTPPQKPGSVQEELPPTKAAEDQNPHVANDQQPLAAELPSQRPAAELTGQLPPAELDSALILANPQEEELHIRYRDAVPFAPGFMELPTQLPPSRSASLYAPPSDRP